MRILHTADIHLGQIIYQNYERRDEHDHYFKQLKKWCLQYQPDALVVSGDLFDIQQPSAATKACFNQYFAEIHRSCPSMKIIMTAGNHDSASRIQADHVIWDMAQTVLIGTSPAYDAQEGWEQKYIIKLPTGYVVALPYMAGDRQEQWQHLLHCVETDNIAHLPVVMMAHTAVAGLDLKGHDFEIGTLKTLSIDQLGEGYDYLALGHIHKPQRMGGRVRYSGSPMAYSFGAEEAHEKGFVLFDTENGEQRFLPVRQLHPHRTVSASCEEILSRQKELENCWLNLSVTDRPAGPELYSEMRERFPYLAFLRGRSAGTGEMTGAITGEELMKMSDTDILKQFLADTESPVTPTEGQLAWFEKTMLAEEEESLQ